MSPPRRRALALCLLALSLGACKDELENLEAGVGSDRDSCGAPGSNSVELAEYSCECEPGFDWCSDAIDEFECCPIEDQGDESEDGGEGMAPELPCDAELAEELTCLAEGEDPSSGVVWACNGERWVEVPNYSTFACMAEGKEFAFGCLPGPSFVCGFGPGSPCEAEGFGSLCVDEDIIDTCVWGRRTVDRCSRLCGELEAFGPGFEGGGCEQLDPEPASCVCQ